MPSNVFVASIGRKIACFVWIVVIVLGNSSGMAIVYQAGQNAQTLAPPGNFNAVVLVFVIPQQNDQEAGIPIGRGTGTVLTGGQYILTAAHLFDGLINAKTTINLDTNALAANNMNLVPESTLFIHPDYTPDPNRVNLDPLAFLSTAVAPPESGAFGGYDVALIKLPNPIANVTPLDTIAPGQAHAGDVVIVGYGLRANGLDGFNDPDFGWPPPAPGGGLMKGIGLNEWDGQPTQQDLEALLKNQNSMALVDFDNGNPGQNFVGSTGRVQNGNVVDVLGVFGDSGGPHLISGAKIAGVQSWFNKDVNTDINPQVGFTYGEVGGATWLGANHLDNPGTPAVDESEETIVDWIRKVMGKASAKNSGSWDNANTWAFNETPSSSSDVFIDRVAVSTTVVTGPNANSQIRSLQVGGSDGDKQLRLESEATLTTTSPVALQGNGLLQVRNGTLAADSVSLAASPSAQFFGELLITGDLGTASVNVTNDIVIDSGGLLNFLGTPTTTSLAANRIIINGTGAFRTNRVGGGSLDLDWEINGFLDLSFPNVDTSTEDFVIMPGRSLTMTDGLIATQTFRIDSGASADVTDTFYGSVIIAATVEVMGTFAMDHGQVTGANLTVTPSGVLDIGLGGLTAYQNFAKLDMSGTTTLAGTLTLGLIDSFGPAIGDSFDILTFGSLVGAFELVTGLDLGNDTWLALAYGASALTITVQLEGDFDGDGFVGIADLNRVLGAWNQIRPAGAPLTGDWSGEMGSWGSKT